ncbi:aminoglycoside phosphotransferase family protein [Paractinoplanes hotanensis]|uniref:Aminoglycoside phosphotransferase family protein n=1 Tax=Paractinoplanes hotanensis TaxID=2906497 RepID=A0ABT0Y885_9ACTN|nr:aminoglycoside phosphotransferase family protein [Actinoplanes hotanensis]MCM4082255.1 aminoglycoside phosphotransferase family protein [Actinoplanes hotanensis]
MASTPGGFLTDVDTLLDLPGLQQVKQLRRTDKAVTIAGRWRGQDVVAKQLTSSERHWVKRFAHEVSVYRAFATTPPPWRVPRLHHAGRRLLIIDGLPGASPHTDRYPPRLPEPVVAGMIDALVAFAEWQPPPGLLSTLTTNWPARIRRYAAAGNLPGDVQQPLLDAVADAPLVFGHGDPLASNALADPGQPLVFIDFEFAGMYPRGADLALLGLWLGRHDPGAERRCAQIAEDGGSLHTYQAMRVLWLAREQRLYKSLFDVVEDREHRQWLDDQTADAVTGLRRAVGRG